MRKTLGQPDTLSLDIDAPISMKMEMKHNMLNLLTGLNGSGKSLILKLTWALSYLMESIITAKENSLSYDETQLIQEIFDKSFTDQDFNGTIKQTFTEGAFVSIEFMKGKVQNVDISIPQGTLPGGVPIFMSTGTRTYEQIKQYLVFRKQAGIMGPANARNAQELTKMTEMYPLYDVVFIERMIERLFVYPYEVPENLVNMLKDDYRLGKFEVREIGIDLTKPDIYYLTEEGDRKSLTTLSKGEQSLVNMFTAQSM